MKKNICISVDILINRYNDFDFSHHEQEFLFCKLSKKWRRGKNLVDTPSNREREEYWTYGLPGREIHFMERINDAVPRIVKEDLGCEVKGFKVFCVNENFALGNHFVTIGVFASVEGDPQNLRPKDWLEFEWLKIIPDWEDLFPSARKTMECAKSFPLFPDSRIRRTYLYHDY